MISSGSSSGNEVSYTSLKLMSSLSADGMFRKLSGNTGTNATTHTGKFGNNAQNAATYTSEHVDNGAKTQSDSTGNVEQLQSQKQSTDTLLLGSSDNTDEGYVYGENSSVTSSFDVLAAAVVGPGQSRVTKDQLVAFLQSLMSRGGGSPSTSTEMAFVKKLIARFDSISEDGQFITSFNGVNDAQDFTTVTVEQVTSPVDVSI